jgi:hypothetical protein
MGFKAEGSESRFTEPKSFSEIIERIKQNPYLKFLHELNPAERDILANRISQSHGVINLDVHPYYFDYALNGSERAAMPVRNQQRYGAIKRNKQKLR